MSDNGISTVEVAQAELNYLNDAVTKASPVFPHSKTTVSASAQRIVDCTQSAPDPFMPNFPYASPWVTKKDNKGKKERSGPPQRCAVQLV